MVRVFYEPPPYGVKTCLNRTGYGLTGGGLLGDVLEKISKGRPNVAMAVATVGICCVCYIPLSKTTNNKLDWIFYCILISR